MERDIRRMTSQGSRSKKNNNLKHDPNEKIGGVVLLFSLVLVLTFLGGYAIFLGYLKMEGFPKNTF
jgi:hypothetical protein